jgi:hypothetical protein
MTEEHTNYSPGFNIHFIQARKAMEDRDNWLSGKLIHIGEDSLDIEVKGEVRRYGCQHASDVRDAIANGEPLGNPPSVMVSERWHVLFVPIGAKGIPPPTVISFHLGVSRIENGSITEALTPGDGYSLPMFSIRRVKVVL